MLASADYNAYQPNEFYAYDANGNRISEKFENSANNQLTSDGKFHYTYDDEGNRIEKKSLKSAEVTKYVWDHRNRLVQVVMPRETVAYVYDFQNRMTRRNDEFIVHDGWQIVLTLNAKGKVKDRNLWGANQDELIATNDQFTLCDHLGNVRDIVNADGKVIGHREYNAFGKVTRTTGKAECPFGYTGKMFDNQTQLQWNINRWYDTEVGRWVSEDPIGFAGGDLNLYRYVGTRVIISVDSLGLCSPCTSGDIGHRITGADGIDVQIQLIILGGNYLDYGTTEEMTGSALSKPFWIQILLAPLGSIYPITGPIFAPGVDYAGSLILTGIRVKTRVKIAYQTRKCLTCWEWAFGIPPWVITGTKWGPWSETKYRTATIAFDRTGTVGGWQAINSTTPADPMLHSYVHSWVRSVINELNQGLPSVDFDLDQIIEYLTPP